MILLLGKNDVIEEYVQDTLKKTADDMLHCPAMDTHYTELGKHVEEAREKMPAIITTQNIEMVDVLLASNLEFEVVTAKRIDNGEIRTRTLSKEDVAANRKAFAFDPRD